MILLLINSELVKYLLCTIHTVLELLVLLMLVVNSITTKATMQSVKVMRVAMTCLLLVSLIVMLHLHRGLCLECLTLLVLLLLLRFGVLLFEKLVSLVHNELSVELALLLPYINQCVLQHRIECVQILLHRLLELIAFWIASPLVAIVELSIVTIGVEMR